MRALPRRVRAHPWLAGGVAVVVLAGGGSAGYFLTRNDKAAAATTTTTQTVATGTVRQSVSATGTLAPASEENLNFSVSGEVTKVAVSEGQHVKKGQTLATIDSASLQATVAQAESTVAGDEARVDDDSSNDATDTQVAADKAALTAAKNQLASAKSQLASATMTSPINGVVAAVNLTVGESVSGNAASNPNASSDSSSNDNSSSDPQILVISTNSWLVNATVDATSVGLIKKGNQAQLTVTGASDTVYGTISSIGLVSSSTSGTASYPVVIEVTGSPSGLHDGANVTATLIYKQVSNVLVVPTLALHRNANGGQYVEQVKNGKTVQTTVRVGIASGGQTQIVSGLSAGDKIIVPEVTLGRGGTGNNGNGSGPRSGTFNFPGGGNIKLPAGGGPIVIPGGGAGG
ncbi:MAG TPA: biotin/lipoyl-binding protein [Jatrophihabitantaceae bacterium]